MKIRLFLLFLICFSATDANAQELEWSAVYNKVDRLQVPSKVNVIYALEFDGWGFPSCPAARHATLSKNDESFEEVYSLLMLAYAQGKKVRFRGVCNEANQDFIIVDYLIIENDLSE